MRIKYFADTDTVLVEFSDRPPVETRELDENIYLDLDADGRVVSLTIEHARQNSEMDEFTYQHIPAYAWHCCPALWRPGASVPTLRRLHTADD